MRLSLLRLHFSGFHVVLLSCQYRGRGAVRSAIRFVVYLNIGIAEFPP
jgi:hypothetical protein